MPLISWNFYTKITHIATKKRIYYTGQENLTQTLFVMFVTFRRSAPRYLKLLKNVHPQPSYLTSKVGELVGGGSVIYGATPSSFIIISIYLKFINLYEQTGVVWAVL